MNPLDELKQHREALLLAEVAAWLHDDFKHTDLHIKGYVSNAPSASGRQDTEDLIPNRNITLLGVTQAFKDVRKRQKSQILPNYLNRCHYAAHIEKQDANSPQSYPAYISSPFGFEGSTIPANLTQDLRQRISWSTIGNSPFTAQHRNQLQREIQTLFTRVGGDTRRSTNEVPLWDWSHIVASLYKSALAGALLGYRPSNADDLHWRLLSVRVNAAKFLDSATRVPDVLARRELLNNALERIRQLLEETYPLATRVYQDEDGSIYVVPNLNNLLSLQDSQGKTLEQLIRQEFAEGTAKNNPNLKLAGELIPEIHLDNRPWWAQSPSRDPAQDEIPPVGAILSREPHPSASSDYVSQVWKNAADEICTVCRLRPQGPSEKAKERKVCDVCDQRRADRSQTWATSQQDRTIWTDEVADTNGRLALIVGHFGLERWLDGTMVQTMVVNEPQNGQAVTKNPSFARLRRIWETTRQFWQEVCPTDERSALADSVVGQCVGQAGPRLEIIPANRTNLDLGPYHTYELVLPRGIRLSLVWDEQNKRFITCDNLEYLGGEQQLGRPVQDVLKKGATFVLEEPVGYGAANKVRGTITLTQDATPIPNNYIPAIPILAEPQTFMTLVPANKALAVVQAIKTKYEREMGKVRNRLPLHLGVIFAHRRTPLRAVLDAGWRMLKQKALGAVDQWEVAEDVVKQTGPLPAQARDLANGTQQFTGWYAVRLQNSTLGRALTWYVPAVMGDGQTEDHWYPYVFLNTGNEPTDRRRRFRAPNPFKRGPDGQPQLGWLVHAGELKKCDIVYFTPATFDFQWLDSAARRFEIVYDDEGRRRGVARRPYLLDELDTLEHIWDTLKSCLTQNQIYALQDLIEIKREEWPLNEAELPFGGIFWQFCRDALANAEWKTAPWPQGQREQWLDTWAGYAARGWLADVIELHLQIMKEEVAP